MTDTRRELPSVSTLLQTARIRELLEQHPRRVVLDAIRHTLDAARTSGATRVTEQEWATIWRLAKGSRARSALMQDIAAWDQSTAEARQAGSLGDLPLGVVYSTDTPLGAEFADMWLQQQTELAALSTRATSVAVSGADPIFDDPAVVMDAVRKVLGQAGGGPHARVKANVPPVPGFRR